MLIRGSPNRARHSCPQVVAIARNGWSRSIGTGGRNQLECQRLQIGPASQISPRVQGGTYLKPD
jgi:hypothetical protein